MMQNPKVAGQRFIVSQTHLHTSKFFTDVLQKRFPELKIEDGEGGDDSQHCDNSAVCLSS